MTRSHEWDREYRCILITPAGKRVGRTVNGAGLRRLRALGFELVSYLTIPRNVPQTRFPGERFPGE